MNQTANLNRTIVDMLYEEAMLLADEARDTFRDAAQERRRTGTPLHEDEDLERIALSCEALRTTTRMMHALSWLLNQRAHFCGELTEFQLRRHGRLPRHQPDSDPAQLALLPAHLRDVVERTRRFHARIARLDQAWRDHFAMHPAAIQRLRERVGLAMAG
ncbi:DUF1465 family protein [Paraurantiacibacter namhicola]|uniref:DUF1465 domain-containing protein n=1 Tax=Paraurantiacibacter namhicola TaxID=645517 RepID=A0A1C7DB78_9SPHN|nr:DUF1465 family protein [Paraurantiacibacter namhicola]ANU08739.1 hypothetical protein A6F65_02458 [Paraurantiacibacter namhicola]